MQNFWGASVIELLLIMLCSTAALSAEVSDALSIAVKLDKNVLTIGDDVIVSAVLKNNSSKVVYFANHPTYAMNHINIRSPKGELLPGFTTARITVLGLGIPRALLVEIPAGGESAIKFAGTLVKKTIPNFKKQNYPKITGAFLDFGTSAILFSENGDHSLQIEFSHNESLSKDAEAQSGVMNIWYGRVISEPVTFQVKGIGE